VNPTVVADTRCECGESPLWHPDQQCLYWGDIAKGLLYRYQMATGEHDIVYSAEDRDGYFGGIALKQDGALLLFMAHGAVRTWRHGVMSTVIDQMPEEHDSIFNDVIVDPEGRVFCGTLPTPSRDGRLYRLDIDGSIEPLVEGVSCSNGLGFSPDLRTLYYTDSTKRLIYAFDYARETGGLSNRRVLVDGPEQDGLPDGMTVDAEGCLWSAHWDGSCVIRYDQAGHEKQRISFPAKQISSVVFAGPDLSDMYATSAGGNDRTLNGLSAGAVFRVRPGVAGVAEFRSRVGI